MTILMRMLMMATMMMMVNMMIKNIWRMMSKHMMMIYLSFYFVLHKEYREGMANNVQFLGRKYSQAI